MEDRDSDQKRVSAVARHVRSTYTQRRREGTDDACLLLHTGVSTWTAHTGCFT